MTEHSSTGYEICSKHLKPDRHVYTDIPLSIVAPTILPSRREGFAAAARGQDTAAGAPDAGTTPADSRSRQRGARSLKASARTDWDDRPKGRYFVKQRAEDRRGCAEEAASGASPGGPWPDWVGVWSR